MDVVPVHPLRAGSVVWQSRASRVLTVVCKATFTLSPVESMLAEDQEHVNEADAYWDDDTTKSVYCPSDLVPFKARADVLLVGYAFAPRGEPVRSLMTRIVVGEIDKSAEVFVDRWIAQDGLLREGQRFTRMPLRYERASGGPGTQNPIGVRSDARPNAYGLVALPNMQPPGLHVTNRSNAIPPIGFGPIAPSWPTRRDRLGQLAATWSPDRWSRAPLPDLDPAFFNSAPWDQQVDALRDNERIILENLHPEHPRLVTSLPGLHPRAFLDLGGGRSPQELGMRCDTLWIDSGRGICTLTWRGHVENPPADGRVVIALEGPGQRLSWADVEKRVASPGAEAEQREGAGVDQPPRHRGQTLTFVGSDGPSSGAPVLPFERASSPPSGPPTSSGAAQLRALSATPPRPGPSLPPLLDDEGARAEDAGPKVPAARGGSSPSWFTASASPAPMPPPFVQPPAPAFSAAPTAPESPWASASAGASALMPSPVIPGLGLRPVDTAGAASSGAAAASDAAAGLDGRPTPAPAPPQKTASAPIVEPARPEPRDIIELLWHDERAVPRVRAWWEELVTRLDFEPADPRHDLSPAEPEYDKSRHNVFGVLTEGEAITSGGIAWTVVEAVNDKGRFTAPLVLIAGELRFPFDELEVLKATIVAATPMSGSDKRLKDSIDALNELVSLSYLQGSTTVTGRLLQQLKEQFVQSNRSLPADYLDAYVERSLLEQRRYQIRKVFGGELIRAQLAPASAQEAPVPVYLPKDLAEKLPMVTSMKARIIAEAHPQQDQYEASPYALRAIAIGRLIQLDGWSRSTRGSGIDRAERG